MFKRLPTSPNLCISDSPLLLLEYQLYSDATHCITGLLKTPWTQGTTKLPCYHVCELGVLSFFQHALTSNGASGIVKGLRYFINKLT